MRTRYKNILFFFLAVLGTAVYLYTQNNWLELTEWEVSSSKIPQYFNNYKILQISDLHSKTFGKDNDKLLEMVDQAAPDLIVLTGDMLNFAKDDGQVFLGLARKLVPHYRICYISGNHEQALSLKASRDNLFWFPEYLAQLESLGVTILNNNRITLQDPGNRSKNNESRINIFGLEIPLWFYEKSYKANSNLISFNLAEMASIMGRGCPQEEFNILLTHNPLYFPVYKEWGADLILAGHLHGGAVRIPFVGGLFSPDRTFFPRYDAGSFFIGQSVMIVNRGLGSGGAELRIHNRPEITVVTLKSEQ